MHGDIFNSEDMYAPIATLQESDIHRFILIGSFERSYVIVTVDVMENPYSDVTTKIV